MGKRLGCWVAGALALAAVGLARQAEAAPPVGALKVSYVAEVRTASWIPILQQDMEHALASKVLAALTGNGQLQLSKIQRDPGTGRLPQPSTPWLLRIDGEVFEDAGNFAVTLTLKPTREGNLPSFAAAAGAVLRKQNKRRIYQRINEAAEQAGKRLWRALSPRLASLSGAGQGSMKNASSDASRLFDWGKLSPPRGRYKGRDLAIWQRQGGSATQRSKRIEAGKRLSGLAYDVPAIRHAFERSALEDPDHVIRHYALTFLGPSSRRYPFTQRVILQVLREDGNPKIRGEAFTLSRAFVGLSLQPTLQTWVELLRTKEAELGARDHAGVAKLLALRPDAPNLDLGLITCLKQEEVLARGGDKRKRSCLDVVKALPSRRRARILRELLDQPLSSFGKIDSYSFFASAARLAFADGCSARDLQVILGRRLTEANEPKALKAIVGALEKSEPTPGLVTVYRAAYERTNDRMTRYAVFQALRKITYWREPPWGVGAWATAKQVVEQLTSSASSRDRRGMVRLQQKLDSLAQQAPQRAGIAAHLDEAGLPKASAVDYLASCVLAAQPARRGRYDCIEGLRWLVLSHPQHRRRALGAVYGLLRRSDVDGSLKRSLGRIVESLERLYAGKGDDRHCWRID